jgi:CRP-like cAMP-binding protein
LIGEISVLDGGPRIHDVDACGAAVLLRLRTEDLERLLARHAPLSNPTPHAGQVSWKKRRIYGLQGERQRRDDRHVIGASPRR